MAFIRKLILVSAEHLPYHTQWLELTKDIAREVGVDYDVRLEDYVFAIEHGKTDEFGMAGLPQLFVETVDNRIYLLLSEIPLGENLELDFKLAKSEALRKIKEMK